MKNEIKKVNVCDITGKVIYKNMIDDHERPFLYWSDGYGFVERYLITKKCWRIESVK